MSAGSRDLFAWAIGPIFLGAAAWLAFGPAPTGAPAIQATPPVSYEAVAATPPRVALGDPPTTRIGGYDQTCQACHKLFESPAEPAPPHRRTQHLEVALDHGLNERCFNCHDREDRDRLVLPGGETIPFVEGPRLCATCHGTTYRDWQAGIHGRTTGSWMEDGPGHRRLACAECHDPHAPAFGAWPLLPGPHTLRLPDHAPAHAAPGHGAEKHNPLRPPHVRHGGSTP